MTGQLGTSGVLLFERFQRNSATIGAYERTRNGQAEMLCFRLSNPNFRPMNSQLSDARVQETLVFEFDLERLRKSFVVGEAA